jgi:hypothetical protein
MGAGTGSNSDHACVATVNRSFNHATDTDTVMAHWKTAFPGKYLQISDLDRPILATIARVGSESVGQGENAETKLVVHFKEPGVKSVVCNLTRSEAISLIAGNPDTDRWPGTKIKLTKGSTRFQGRRVDCISIVAPDDVDAQLAEVF